MTPNSRNSAFIRIRSREDTIVFVVTGVGIGLVWFGLALTLWVPPNIKDPSWVHKLVLVLIRMIVLVGCVFWSWILWVVWRGSRIYVDAAKNQLVVFPARKQHRSIPFSSVLRAVVHGRSIRDYPVVKTYEVRLVYRRVEGESKQDGNDEYSFVEIASFDRSEKSAERACVRLNEFLDRFRVAHYREVESRHEPS